MPRWFHPVLAGLLYLEMVSILTWKVHFPVKPDPVFQKPNPVNEYHWTKGPYDDDWDGCWIDQGRQICLTEEI